MTTMGSDAARTAVVRDVVSPAPRNVWLTALSTDPTALPSQSPEWLDAVGTLADWSDASRLYDFGQGRHAILPLVRRRIAGLPVETAGSYPPSWGFGGLVAPGGATAAEVAAVFTDLRSRPALRTFVRPNPLTGSVWAEAATLAAPAGMATTARSAHVLD